MNKPQCSKCGRALKDPFSIAIGMGPECRGSLSKKGWKFPKPKWRVRAGHVELIGMTGKIVEPPTVNTEAIQQKVINKKRKHAHNQLKS
jgi:hypothetical protein